MQHYLKKGQFKTSSIELTARRWVPVVIKDKTCSISLKGLDGIYIGDVEIYMTTAAVKTN